MKPVKDFPGYFVTEDGRVFSENRKKIKERKLNLLKNGYLMVAFFSKKNRKAKYVHRIVYEAYIGELIPGLDINHIDLNKKNNHYSNLEQVTRLENVQHAYRNGLHKGKSVIGICIKSKKEIKFESALKAAKFLGKDSAGNITNSCNGKRNNAYGYTWQYA